MGIVYNQVYALRLQAVHMFDYCFFIFLSSHCAYDVNDKRKLETLEMCDQPTVLKTRHLLLKILLGNE